MIPTLGHHPIYISATPIVRCTKCGEPAICQVNVNMDCTSSVPSRFEWRCAEHGLKLNFHQEAK